MSALAFKKSMGAFIDKLGKRASDVSIGMASLMAENIIVGGKFSPGTPVDTGNARGSWYPALNGEPASSASGVRGGVVASDLAAIAFRNGKAGDTFELWTNVVYMPPLEYGHSKQAPRGMVRLTLRNAQNIGNAANAEIK